jgi:hypothetical protein
VFRHAEVRLEFCQRLAGLGGDGGVNRGSVPPVERDAVVGPRAGRGLAGGSAALLEATHPRRADGKLRGDRPRAAASVESRQHAVANILRKGFQGSSS